MTQDLRQADQRDPFHRHVAYEAQTAIVKGKILYPYFLASRMKIGFDILKKPAMLIAEKVVRLQLISFPHSLEQFFQVIIK
jgi:hypothetical protein